MRKIVILDGYAANPGDLSWDEFAVLGELTIYDRTAAEAVLERAAGAEVLLTNKTPLTAATIAALPALRYIGVLATGTNIVDTAAARSAGVIVANVPGYSTDSVAQLVFSLILEQSMQVGRHDRSVHGGGWASCVDFSYACSPLVELAGKTLGVVGFGAIGQRICEIGRAFGMNVMVHTRTIREINTIEFTDLESLLAKSDFVSLNCPLTDSTRHLINDARLAKMKPGAMLINTARGPLLDEAAVARALQEGRLAAAAVDVLSSEPPPAANPLLTAPNCIITPHIGWATREARVRLLTVAAENLKAYCAGSPVNTVG